MSARPYKPGPSGIHGLGVIAIRLIHAGERIHVDLGPDYRGFNHECSPTLGRMYRARGDTGGARLAKCEGRLYAPYRFALRDVEPGSELTIDYRTWPEGLRRPNGSRLEFICNCPKCQKENER